MKVNNKKLSFNLNFFAIGILFLSFFVSFLLSSKTAYNFSTLGNHKTPVQIFIQIISHNYLIFLACLISYVFGRWIIIINLSLNMMQLGYILGSSANAILTFVMLLPHGIFEIPAILIMANLCWKGPEWALQNKKNFLKFFLLANLLLVIAAIVEAIYIFIVK